MYKFTLLKHNDSYSRGTQNCVKHFKEWHSSQYYRITHGYPTVEMHLVIMNGLNAFSVNYEITDTIKTSVQDTLKESWFY